MELLIADLNRMFSAAETPVFIALSRWETDVFPGLHEEGPQGLIDQNLDIETSDLLLGIFRRRFGTPVNDAGSGTEHEIRRAIRSFRSKGTPQVMLYFGEVTGHDQDLEEDEQWRKVDAFKQEMMLKEKALVWNFSDLHDLKGLLQGHLFKFVMQLERRRTRDSRSPVPAVRVLWKPEVVQLRSEGFTELLGNFFLHCTSEGQWQQERPLHIGLIVFLNTTLTCRPDDPVLIEVGRPGASAVVPCTKIEGNSVTFAAVPLQGIGEGETRVFQLSNLRCNANVLGSLTDPGAVRPVMAYVSVIGTQIEDEVQEVARINRGLRFEVKNVDGTPRTGPTSLKQSHSLPPTAIATLRFDEGFPWAFKARLRGNPGYMKHDSRLVDTGESCSVFSATKRSDGSIHHRGMADFGTRLQVLFNNVSDSMRLFVSAFSRAGLHSTLVEHESSLLPGTGTEVIGNQIVRELEIRNCSARAVWEVADQGWPRCVSFVEVGVFAAYEANPRQNLPWLGVTTVNGSFGPTPPAFTASAGSSISTSFPIPRFIPDWQAAVSLLRVVVE